MGILVAREANTLLNRAINVLPCFNRNLRMKVILNEFLGGQG